MKFFQRFFRKPIDLAAPGVALDPFPHYETLRRGGPVQFLEKHDAWIVLGHDEVQAAFSLPEVFSNRPYEDVDAVLLAADPPQHTAIRRIVSRYFAREVIEELDAFAAQEATSLLRPRLDIVDDYGRPLSEAVAARLLGFGGDSVAAIRAAYGSMRDFEEFVRALDTLAERAVMYRRLRDDGLADAQARSLVRLFWLASTKTTERVIAECVLALLQHDDVRRAVERDHALIGPFIEEVMRLHQPEPMLRRLTTQPAQLGGRTIPAGSMVYLCLAAANRDPAKYEAPAELRLGRTLPARHLTFGHGIHHCIGATLGRAEVTTALRILLTAAPRFRAAQPLEQVTYRATMTARFIERLLVEAAPA